MKILKRICSNCYNLISYKTKSQLNDAIKKNRMCKSCSTVLNGKLRKYHGSLEKQCVCCDSSHLFSSYQKYNRAKPIGEYICKKCAIIQARTGSNHTEEAKNKIRMARIGTKLSDDTKKKISEKMMGHNNPCYGRCGKLSPMYGMSGILSPTYGMEAWNKGKLECFSKDTIRKMRMAKKSVKKWKGTLNPNYGNHAPLSDEHRRKVRLAHIKRIEEIRCGGHQLKPNFNISACQIIDEYGKQHGYEFQHAMNGGEYFIKHLGYWVDGYDQKKNVVIDFYEDNHHHYNKDGTMKIKDLRRIEEIKRHLGCQFIILEENKL
jgi:hypothetical protein